MWNEVVTKVQDKLKLKFKIENFNSQANHSCEHKMTCIAILHDSWFSSKFFPGRRSQEFIHAFILK